MEHSVARPERKGNPLWRLRVVLGVLALSLCVTPVARAQSGTEIRDALLGKIPINAATMDVNQDGKVDVADLIAILKRNGRSLAEFADSSSTTTEGGMLTVPVNFFPAFSGQLKYTLAGTAEYGVDYTALTGSVATVGDDRVGTVTVSNAESFALQFALTEDGDLEPTETLELTLQEANVAQPPYLAGPIFLHTAYIADNDEMWSGVITHTDPRNAGLMVNVRLKIMRLAGGTLAGALVTDGVGIIPLHAGHTPETEWPLSTLLLDADTFSAAVGPMPVDVAFAGAQETMERRFSFSADPQTNPDDHEIDLEAGLIAGTFTETMVLSSRPTFGYASAGQVILMKEPPLVATPAPTPTP